MNNKESEDFYSCNDSNFGNKKAILSFNEWEKVFFDMYYPRCKKTFNLYKKFVEWHYIYLKYRYTR